jgi:hypothetical protein
MGMATRPEAPEGEPMSDAKRFMKDSPERRQCQCEIPRGWARELFAAIDERDAEIERLREIIEESKVSR